MNPRTPYGEKPSGHFIFTRGGYFAWNYFADGRKAPAGPVATEAERIALFNTTASGSGTWRVEGTTVSFKYTTSSNQSWTGTERKAPALVSGKTLTMTSAPFKAGFGNLAGKDVTAITTFERLE